MQSDYERIREVFLAASALDPDARSAFLDAECANRPDLRAQVEEILPFHDRPADGLEPLSGRRPETIGPYRVLQVLGAGGMGIVYLAEQSSPRRTVALKVLRPGTVGAKTLKRFTREAEILGRLTHPGIARIFDAGTDGDGPEALPYFVMERIEGSPITDFARARELDTRARLKLFTQVCDAVAHAHDHGVIHRDLKPSNILVSEQDGRPKVLDFGVARLAEGDDAAMSLRTETGQLIGTLPYMSPEQVSGDARDLDGRSDVYALGVLLYELLSGKLPLDLTALGQLDAARKIRDEDPTSIGELKPELRGDIDTILETALRKDRATRYATVRAFADDVRRHLNDEVIAARPASALYKVKKFTRRHRALVAGTSIAFLALLAGLVVAIRSQSIASEQGAAARRTAYRLGIGAAQNAIEEGRTAEAKRLLAESPEELRGWEWRLFSAALQSEVATWSAGSDQGTAVTVTSDGRAVGALCAGGTLFIRDLRTDEVLHELTGPPPLTHPVLSSDATHAAVLGAAREQLLVFDLESGATALSLPIEDWVSEEDRHRVRFPHAGPSLSTDGRLVAAWTTPRRFTVFETSTARIVQQLPIEGRAVHFSSASFRPDGAGVFVSGAGVGRCAYLDLVSEENHVFSEPLGTVNASHWDTDGATLWITIASELLAVRPPSFEPRATMSVASPSEFPLLSIAVSPDGNRCAISGQGRGTSPALISIIDLATRSVVRRVRGEQEGAPLCFDVFDPDRLFISHHERIRAHSLDSGPSRVLRGHDTFVYHAAFSPDGRRIASQDWTGRMCLWDRDGRRLASIERSIAKEEPPEVDRPVAIGFTRDGLQVLDLRVNSLRTFDVLTERVVVRPRRPGEKLYEHQALYFAQVAGGANTGPAHHEPRCTDSDELLRAEGEGKVVTVLDTSSGEIVARPLLPPRLAGSVTALAIDSRRRWLAYGDSLGDLRLWDLKRDRLTVEIEHADSNLFAVAFHPDGRRLASAGRSGIVRLWDTETWELVAELRGHTDYVHDLEFSPDGEQLVSASGDKTLRLWDVRNAAERAADDEKSQRASAAIRPRVIALLERANDLDAAHGRMLTEGWSQADRTAADRVFIEELRTNGQVRFDPPGRNHRKPVDVRLSAGPDVARIHYTLDGSEPTADSPAFVDPLRLSDPTVLSARAFPYGVPGPTTRHHYTFDPFAIPLASSRWETWGDGESTWRFDHGVLRQTTAAGVFRPTQREDGTGFYGAMRIYNGKVADDGALRVGIRSQDKFAMGVAFRFQSPRQHYLFHWERERRIRSLIRRDGDDYVCLARDDVPHEHARWYDVEIVLDGPRLAVRVDGEEVLSATDDTYPGGAFALHTARSVNVDFAALAFEPKTVDTD